MKPALIGAALALAVSFLAPVAAQAAGSTWTVDSGLSAPPQPDGALASVSCQPGGPCVAVGSYLSRPGFDKTLIEQQAGGKWSIVASPNPAGATNGELAGVSCPATGSCVAVGYASTNAGDVILVERLSGGTWTIEQAAVPAGALSADLAAVSCVSSTFCVAVGEYVTSKGVTRPLVETYAAGHWQVTSAPAPTGATTSYLAGVSCVSTTSCVAVGSGNPGGGDPKALVETLTGTSWAVQHVPAPTGASYAALSSVSCTGSAACMAVGQYYSRAGTTKVLAEQLTAAGWALSPVKNATGASYSQLEGVSCSSATSCDAVGEITTSASVAKVFAESFDSGTWSVTSIQKPVGADTNSELRGVACPSATSCVTVGDIYTNVGELPLAESSSGAAWTITPAQKATGPQDSQILGVSCASTTMCMAVGGINVDTGTALAELWNGTSWTTTPTPNPDHSNATFWSVSCPTTTLCVAVGTASGKPVAGVWNGTTWTLGYAAFPSGSDSAALISVSCPSTTVCFSAGFSNGGGAQHGLVEKWNGSTWSVVTTPAPSGDVSSALYAVSCASTTSCVAVGSGPDASFNYHGWALSFSGSSWTQTGAPGGEGLMGISCPSTTFCMAVGYAPGAFASTWNGSGWSPTFPATPSGSQGTGFQAVSCTASTACTAVGSNSTDTSQNALIESWDGSGWWLDTSRSARGASSTDLEDVSCVPSLCYAVGSANAQTNVPFAEYTS